MLDRTLTSAEEEETGRSSTITGIRSFRSLAPSYPNRPLLPSPLPPPPLVRANRTVDLPGLLEIMAVLAALMATLSGLEAVLLRTPSLCVTGVRASSPPPPRETNLFTSVREGMEAEPVLTLPDVSLVVVVTVDLFLWAGLVGDLEEVEEVMVLVRGLLEEEDEEVCFDVTLMILFLSTSTGRARARAGARGEGPCAAGVSMGCEVVLSDVEWCEVVIEGL